MGLYNVVAPCVVGKLHYARPTTQPVEVYDAEAGPLVESGCLESYRPGGIPGLTGTVAVGALTMAPDLDDATDSTSESPSEPVAAEADDEPPTIPPPARKPRARRSEG